MVIYHGAPIERKQDIIKSGLRKRFSQWKPRRVFLTTDFEAAKFYAVLASSVLHPDHIQNTLDYAKYTGRVVIFKIKISKTELHLDQCLDNCWQDRRTPHSFYVLRDIPPDSIVTSTLHRHTVIYHCL